MLAEINATDLWSGTGPNRFVRVNKTYCLVRSDETGCWMPSAFDRTLMLVIDALRFDFLEPSSAGEDVSNEIAIAIKESASMNPCFRVDAARALLRRPSHHDHPAVERLDHWRFTDLFGPSGGLRVVGGQGRQLAFAVAKSNNPRTCSFSNEDRRRRSTKRKFCRCIGT